MQEYQAGAPMERVPLDFLGPLPKTPRGNEYVLMMVDQFTKWMGCVPLPSQTAEVTAKAAVDGFFSRFGYPFQIFTDRGRNFGSNLFTAICEALEIHKARITPYRPSANGQVERYNRTLMDAVRCYIKDSQDQWDLHLQQIAGALRRSVNRNTGYTANWLMLGREVNTPAYLMFPQPAVENQTTDQYVATLTKNIRRLIMQQDRSWRRHWSGWRETMTWEVFFAELSRRETSSISWIRLFWRANVGNCVDPGKVQQWQWRNSLRHYSACSCASPCLS